MDLLTACFGYVLLRCLQVLLQTAGRGDAFFEEELSLYNLPSLLKAGALRSSFEQRVVADTTTELDQRVRTN